MKSYGYLLNIELKNSVFLKTCNNQSDEIIIKLIAVDLSRQKELHADLKVIQQIEFLGQLNNVDRANAYGT